MLKLPDRWPFPAELPRVATPPAQKQIAVGDRVRYHPIIGLKHDGGTWVVRAVGDYYGQPCYWLEGKPDAVDLRAVSPYVPARPVAGMAPRMVVEALR